jgi:putative colanic acid biosynthesis acetyltransferase WcaF
MPLLKPPIHIADDAWICADAFLGPGVTIGEGAIVGARAVVTKNVAPWTVVVGNPAKFVKNRVCAVKTGLSD